MPTDTVEDLRLKELAGLALVDAELDPLFQKICQFAATVFNVPMSTVSIIDGTCQHLVAGAGVELGCSAREHAICNITIQDDAPYVVEDAHADAVLQTNPFVVETPHIRFYAGIPLSLTPGVRLGAFCIADTSPRRLSREELATLCGFAELVVDQIRHHADRKELARQALELAGKQAVLLKSMADLQWTASHDALTGLPNRAAITKQIADAVEADTNGVALIMLDIDRFKTINDTLGHDAGDTVLVAVAGRLKAAVGTRGFAARTGGDEFAVLVDRFQTEGEIASLATDILIHMREPVTAAGAAVDARATLGIAVRTTSATGAAELFKEADIALYNAKEAGRDGFVFFQPAMREEIEARVTGLAMARAAVFAGRIEPYYQPKICLLTNRVVGFEALLRWHHPSKGLCGPDAMGDVFSDTELAVAIGRSMLYRAAADMVEWRRRKLEFGHVAINIAEPEFFAGDYAERIFSCLAMHGLTTDMLEVEVTECVFLGRRSSIVARTLRKLDEGGISIALDDFGTGYASLTHLKQHPVSSIKIDRSFVSDVEGDADAAAIVEAVTSLANSLRIGVVAEGIETPAQLAFLRARTCAIGQGYLFAKPMPASRVPHFLRNWAATRQFDESAQANDDTRKIALV